MRITTLNMNGIRSASRKGFFPWLAKIQPDVVCLQETKSQHESRSGEMVAPDGYIGYFHDAQKKGYSGVAIYTRTRPDRIVEGVGWPDIDLEGRYIQADFGKLSVVSVYFPSGSSGPERQAVKFKFLDHMYEVLSRLRRQNREFILCGDWNIAHKPIDLKNWRGNQKNSGFLPEEREWLDRVFDKLHYVDAFRVANQEPDQYTWWSNRGQAWAKNVGWRIDYQITTPGLRDAIRTAEIYKAERFSDHAPLTMEYGLAL